MNGVNARITAVILTHNRTFEVLRTVERMSQLPEHPPIIVVDNASNDNISALVRRRFPQVNVIRLHRNIGAAARNVGVQSAITPYVAFCDDDTLWTPGSLDRAVRLLDLHPGVAVLTARVLVGTEDHEDGASADMAASPLPSDGLPGRAVVGFLAGACVVRRHAFLQAGGYEAKLFIGGEEALLALDLAVRGWSLVYSDRLTVRHYPSALRDGAARQRLLLRNRLWVAWLRRAPLAALRISVQAAAAALHARPARDGFIDALRGLAWALRNRRAVPLRVEEMCALVERTMRRAMRGAPCPASAAAPSPASHAARGVRAPASLRSSAARKGG
jgi:GT2 family glycosyltransferase